MMLFFAMLGAWNLVLFAPLVCVLAWDSLRQLHGRVLLILVTKGDVVRLLRERHFSPSSRCCD